VAAAEAGLADVAAVRTGTRALDALAGAVVAPPAIEVARVAAASPAPPILRARRRMRGVVVIAAEY
jgi:hypothetical protein